MVLLDHFRPPLNARRHWHAFHNAWATYIAADLNQSFPEGYFAEPNVQFGIEIDVTRSNETAEAVIPLSASHHRKWSPPASNQTIPFQSASESVEISIFSNEFGPTLAGAIELVSPANKDRHDCRQAFIAKCEGYLRQGSGLMVVDGVTGRKANLHDELVARLTSGTFKCRPLCECLSCAATGGATEPEYMVRAARAGKKLPTLPLWLPEDSVYLSNSTQLMSIPVRNNEST